jgi:hypothetical protein
MDKYLLMRIGRYVDLPLFFLPVRNTVLYLVQSKVVSGFGMERRLLLIKLNEFCDTKVYVGLGEDVGSK